ncbi:alpha/beta fold hydrolase [Actinomadura sp. LD22]|uniref:Alpha/beta fold hydrolase n=1 Tax=Actinomadura physcomitrii TaxID=2650748 RepID=A0A6I4MRG6_9ACTN|nr:alpha/beta fold hydrolase [Actinomadura physcomitrii]MWA07365.1 alpha/beta fold hydrolase [Actinomadura physcomitrii]
MTLWTDLAGVDYEIRYEQVGPWRTRVLERGHGPALVFLHGTGGHLEAFARNLRALGDRFRVVAYDLPGHGWSTLTGRDLEIADYQEHLLGLLDALRIPAAHLSGESLGGWVAAKFAAAHPERVSSLILNTPGGTMADPAVMERIRSLSQAAADDPSYERIRTRLEWLMADPASVTGELVAIRQSVYAQPGFPDSMRHLLCLQDPQIRRRNLLTDAELDAITAPTLVIWTTDDPSGPPSEGEALAGKINGAQFRLIKDAGHWPQWEQRAVFDALVIDFVTRNTS